MALHPQMWALRRRQNYQLGLLFGEFVQQHPDIDPELDNWTTEQEQAWREYTEEFSTGCQAERHALAVELGLLPRDSTRT